MTAKQYPTRPPASVLDLTATPYFPAQREPEMPLVVKAASGLERVRDDDDTLIRPDYALDRVPSGRDPNLRFGGGAGGGSVLTDRRPRRLQRLWHIDVLTVAAVTVVLAVATVMITLAVTLHP